MSIAHGVRRDCAEHSRFPLAPCFFYNTLFRIRHVSAFYFGVCFSVPFRFTFLVGSYPAVFPNRNYLIFS